MPPAAAPIGLADLAAWTKQLVSAEDPRAALCREMSTICGVRRSFLVGTARAGLAIILQALRDLAPSDRTEVIVPSYTCFSVPASVVKAGLTPRIVDVTPETLDYDPAALERVDTRRALAIIATNLFGFPNDMLRLEGFARANRLFLVDDAAQALGARFRGRWAGTWGDVGLYSFDKGKPVSAIAGGVIVTGAEKVASAIEWRIRQLPPPGPREAFLALARLAAYVTFLSPRLYWIPAGIPPLGLGKTVYTTSFPVARGSRLLTSLSSVMLRKRSEFGAHRRRNALELRTRLDPIRGLSLVAAHPLAEPAFLRLPLLAPDRARQVSLIDSLNAAGIGATGSYPSCIGAIPELRHAPGAVTECAGGAYIAERIVTLPTHPLLTSADVETTIETIEHTLEEGHRVSSTPAAPVTSR